MWSLLCITAATIGLLCTINILRHSNPTPSHSSKIELQWWVGACMFVHRSGQDCLHISTIVCWGHEGDSGHEVKGQLSCVSWQIRKAKRWFTSSSWWKRCQRMTQQTKYNKITWSLWCFCWTIKWNQLRHSEWVATRVSNYLVGIVK